MNSYKKFSTEKRGLGEEETIFFRKDYDALLSYLSPGSDEKRSRKRMKRRRRKRWRRKRWRRGRRDSLINKRVS